MKQWLLWLAIIASLLTGGYFGQLGGDHWFYHRLAPMLFFAGLAGLSLMTSWHIWRRLR